MRDCRAWPPTRGPRVAPVVNRAARDACCLCARVRRWPSCRARRGRSIVNGTAVGRAPESGDPLCSQPMLSRLENAPLRTEIARLIGAMVDQFLRELEAGAGLELVEGRRGARAAATGAVQRALR